MESAGDIDALFLPVEELGPDPDVAAAEASALEDPRDVPVTEDPPVPFGRSWLFDWSAGRFVRQGRSPTPVSGTMALREWLITASRSAWNAHAVFSKNFGTERPESALGRVGSEALLEAGDWAARLREAWLVHDRIVAVEGLDVRMIDDTIWLGPFTVVTDENEEIPIEPFPLEG